MNLKEAPRGVIFGTKLAQKTAGFAINFYALSISQ
jgi:hypothetical protein